MLRLIVLLLACWAGDLRDRLYFAHNAFDFIGWPFSFWMAAYGAPAYWILIVIYALVMNRFDASSRTQRDD